MDETIRILPWHDPVIDTLGHDPRAPYPEKFWLPTLGPSALFLIRYLADGGSITRIVLRRQVSPHRQDLVTRRLDDAARSSAVALAALARNLYTVLTVRWRQASARAGDRVQAWHLGQITDSRVRRLRI